MNQTNQAISVNATKLFWPPIPGDFVPRRGLHELLDKIERRPLTVVSAPAGYGKSTTISAWLQEGDRLRAWLTLGEDDNHLTEFLTYFLAALNRVTPIIAPDLASMVEGSGAIPTPRFLAALNAGLDTVDRSVTLVLDDFQVITNAEILELITEWMHHPHPALHLVLLTRHDPTLPLAVWRARNQMVDIRSHNLRFSLEEEEQFLRAAANIPLDAEVIAQLRAGTEGWAAALRLASLSLAQSRDIQGSGFDLTGIGRQDVMDYLASQVLDGLPAHKQAFLIKTSILKELTGDLCDFLLSETDDYSDGQVLLEELCRANCFLTATSGDGQWFRYHQLFREFLQSRLAREYSPQTIAHLNVRAGKWLADHGYVNESIHHALAADDLDSVLAMVAEYRHQLMNEDRWRNLESWYRLIPRTVVDTSPDLLLLRGWLAQYRHFDMRTVEATAVEVDNLLGALPLEPDRARQLAAENAVLRAIVAYFRAEPESAVRLCRLGLQDLPISHYVARSYACLFLAAGQQMLNNLDAAYEAIHLGRREDLAFPVRGQSRGSGSAGFISWMVGDLSGVRQAGEGVLATSSLGSQPQSVVWAHYFLAGANYHENKLDEALEHAQFSFDNRYSYHAHGAIQAGFIVVQVHVARGNYDMARAVMSQLEEYVVWVKSEPLAVLVQSMRCELAVRSGRPNDAFPWVEQALSRYPLGAMPLFFAAALTVPKALLATYDPRRSTELGDYLRALRQHVEHIHNTPALIEVLALEAMFRDRQGDEQAALALLAQSLSLAERSGFLRLHRDLGPQMHALLERLVRQNPSDTFAAQVSAGLQAAVLPQGNEALVESLTKRECEVLVLLEERLSNKEIALELFITEATVKRHTINIYQKLGVNGRRDAVRTAQSLGLLALD
jgi:LuxR family maltose regulon positive regulatory protein